MGKAIYFGIDNIIGALDRVCQGNAGFYYCVWQNSKSKCFQYNGGSYEDGIEYLRENLEPFAEAGYVGDLFLKIYPNPCKSFFTWATEDICTLAICPTSKDLTPEKLGTGLSGVYGLQPQGHQYSSAPINKGGKILMTEDQWEERQAIKTLPDTIAGIVQAEIAKLNIPVADVEPEPEPDTMQSVMIGHLKNPQLMGKLLDMLGELIPMLKSPATMQQQQFTRQVAGVPGTVQKEQPMKNENISAPVEAKQEPDVRSDIVDNGYTAADESQALTAEQEQEMIAYNNKLDDALRRLALIPGFDLADDLTALANFAEKNQETFNRILPVVRNG